MIGRILLYAVLGVLFAFVANVIYMLDINKRIFSHRPGPCRYVEGIEDGAEDIEIIYSKGIAFVSSGVYYLKQREGIKGEIFLLDLKQTEDKRTAKKLKIEGTLDRTKFFPHGISAHIENGKIRLFVIAHAPPDWQHSVEVFDYDEKSQTLKHVRTIRDEKFIRPNEIIALGPDSFLISNDGVSQTPLGNTLEILSLWRGGSIVYYDGKNSHYTAKGMLSPNGLAINKEKTHLFVASPNGEFVGVYKLANDFKSIEIVNKIDLFISPDNLSFDEKGGLWLGCWSHGGHTRDFLEDVEGAISPAQVLRITFRDDYTSESIREVYADDGRAMSGTTVAAFYRKQLLIGTVRNRLLQCDVENLEVI